MSSINKKLLAKASQLGWGCSEDESGGVEFNQGSPAGEDFSFYIRNKTELAKAVREYANSFDPDEHIVIWVNAKHSVSGVPDIRTLVKDADAIQKMLNELADTLEEVQKNDESRTASGSNGEQDFGWPDSD